MLGTLLGIIIALALAGLVIWIVGRLNLGLTVDGFGTAFIAAAVIAVIAGVISWLLGLLGITLGGGFLGAIIAVLISAAVLLLAGRILPGLKVKGYTGAIIASIAIGVVTWLAVWFVSLFT